MRYAARIRYMGQAFSGFQVQPGKRTVQGVLQAALEALFGVPCTVTGCSRTDSGVHARSFCVLLAPSAPCPSIPPAVLPRALAPHLPPDLSLYAAIEAPAGFHPRYDVQEKEYVYTILTAPVRDPFYAGRAFHYPRPIGQEAFAAMCTAAAAFVGTHDFSSLMAQGSSVSDTVRTVYACTCQREGDLLRITVRGNGFLYHMVRILAGTLLEVAEGKMSPSAMAAVLAGRDRRLAGRTAPAEGLCLSHVRYPDGLLPGLEE